MTAIQFDSGYYASVVASFGYSDFRLDPFSKGLGGQDADELALRYLCQTNLDAYCETQPEHRIVTTGFGMSGPPHLGTIVQMLGIRRLLEAGERCQLVFGDLDAYGGKNKDLEYTRTLAAQYTDFAGRLGIDSSFVTSRNQYESLEVLREMYLVSRFTTESEFVESEEANHAHYVANGVVTSEMTLPRRLSLLLMTADFVSLGLENRSVLIQLGVDEHGYVRFSDKVRQRALSHPRFQALGSFSAIYTRMIPGFNGHPKMSKSLPGSGIDVTSSPDEVVRAFNSDFARDPGSSPTFQIGCQLPEFGVGRLREAAMECGRGSRGWDRFRSEVADVVIEILSRWR